MPDQITLDPKAEQTSELQRTGAVRKPQDTVKTWTIAVAVIIIVVTAYSMVADRLTPYTGDARVQAFIVRISPEVAGRVISIGVKENEYVTAGRTLFQIDPEPYRIAVEREEAVLAAAGQTVGASTAAVDTAQAKLTSAIAKRDNIRIESERVFTLVDKKIYAKSRGDQAKSSLDQAEAAVVAAESELTRARQELGPKGENPQVRQAIMTLRAAQLNLEHTTIVAPSEGVVTNLQLDDGQYAAGGQPAMTFIDARLIWILANMRENSLENVKPGAEAEVVLDSLPGRVFEARVESIGWGVAGGGSDAGTGLPQLEAPSEWLLPAQRFPVRLEFTTNRPPQGVRYNSRASVVVYTGGNIIVNALAALWIRVISYASYVY